MNEQENDQSHAEAHQQELEHQEWEEWQANDAGYLEFLKECAENDLRKLNEDRKLKKAV